MQECPSQFVELKPLTTPERALTRSQLTAEGIEVGKALQVGDFVCVEVDSLQEPWMI